MDARAGTPLATLALDPARPAFRVSFRHSVHGTEVVDRYEVRGARVVLVEESFEGEGYGLPSSLQPGERVSSHGGRTTLHTARDVHPLAVRASRAQRTAVHVDAPRPESLTLADFGEIGVRFDPIGCEG